MKGNTMDRFARLRRSPVMDLIDFRIVSFDAGSMTVHGTVEFDPQLSNVMGTPHGGAIAAALDTAASVAGMCATDFRSVFPTLEMKCLYLGVPHSGALKVKGRVLKLGRSIAFLEASLLSTNDELLATSTQTARVRSAD